MEDTLRRKLAFQLPSLSTSKWSREHYLRGTRETCEKGGTGGRFIFMSRARLACFAHNSRVTKDVVAAKQSVAYEQAQVDDFSRSILSNAGEVSVPLGQRRLKQAEVANV